MLKEANLEVYLKLDEQTRAKRIQNREGGDLEEIKKFTQMRDFEDSRRYKQLYNIDNNVFDFVDLEIDTGINNPEQVVNIILNKLKEKNFIEEF
jgi:cytidylate kinase